MAVICENTFLNGKTYKMVVKLDENTQLGKSGQFYMIKTSASFDPFLNRPISIFDTNETNHTVTFIYVVVGRGTELMSKMRAGDTLNVYGPYGNGFPITDSDITLIGGGVGAAPLYLLAKEHKEMFPERKIKLHLGFANDAAVALTQEFDSVCDNVSLNIGGYVTDDVDFSEDVIYYSCGTVPMMTASCRCAGKKINNLYVSLDNHMACGVGACLVCTCKTKDGTKKRACKDGPVFLASDIFDTEKEKFYE